ncbi:MAG TPA: hypothetical protein VGK59_23850 [Ohtaekwangia sp.]
MPALSYKGRFVEYVEAGLKPKPKKDERIKRQTIRNFRKIPVKKGSKLYHYFAQRSAEYSRKLGESICTSCRNVILNHKVALVANQESGTPDWKGSYTEIKTAEELDRFAYEDGFANWEEMRKWWVLTHGPDCFPFFGQLIKW